MMMPQPWRILALLCVMLLPLTARADYPEEFAPVVKIFSGLSYSDHDMIRASTTPDFLLLEVGEVWDLPFLLGLVNPSERERDNYFSIISVERFDGAALVNYWNKAVIQSAEGESVRAWLESVVAVETADGWRLKQMHSTRIDPDSIPDDITLTRHMLPKP